MMQCESVGPQGWRCVLATGHHGGHLANRRDDWPNLTPPPKVVGKEWDDEAEVDVAEFVAYLLTLPQHLLVRVGDGRLKRVEQHGGEVEIDGDGRFRD
jgi:hypothetical protein